MLYDCRDIGGFLEVKLEWIHPIHKNPGRTQWPCLGNSIDLRDKKVCLRLRDPAPFRIDQFHSKSVEKCSVFIIFECSHDAVFKVCRLENRLQNASFIKSASKKCNFHVNKRPIRHIFHCFQNVPASCLRSLS